ncbi:UDP-glycosyltransferase UGT4-like [Atheta coriaria]|uniref:UDP-glycosyltransferase UGT4-like n=1 Tax=Dalotia coriaria TaxID=877792 RepID=UPI0031F3F3F1
MLSTVLSTYFLLCAFQTLSECANILGIFPIPSRSHAILGHKLLRGFAEHGHNVTMLTFFPESKPHENFKTILMDIEKPRHVYESNIIKKPWFTMKVIQMFGTLGKISEVVYEDKQVQKLINSNNSFDAVIYFQCTADSLLGFSHKFNASSIMFSVLGSSQMSSYSFGHSLPSAYVPNVWLGYNDEMTLWQRFHNWISNIVGDLYLNTYHTHQQRRLLRENFPQSPSLDELRENVELELVNSHIAIDTIRPTHQNMIDIGGYYMGNREYISEDIKELLDQSKNGVILLSFGTNLNRSNMSPQLINAFLDYFKRSKYDVLWKFDVNFVNNTKNMKIVNWLPQREVLSHSSVKLFITHGGKGSINEAVYHGVPMIVLPFYADQHANAEYCVKNRIGIKLDVAYVNSDILENAIQRIEQEPHFKNNIQVRSNLFKNQEINPMKKAIFWTEAI